MLRVTVVTGLLVLALAVPAGADTPDTTPPTVTNVVGFQSPAYMAMGGILDADDAGSGVHSAVARLDGVEIGGTRALGCLPEPDDPPFSLAGCPAHMHMQIATILADRGFALGDHHLTVTVDDGAGNVTIAVDKTLTIVGSPIATPTPTPVPGDPIAGGCLPCVPVGDPGPIPIPIPIPIPTPTPTATPIPVPAPQVVPAAVSPTPASSLKASTRLASAHVLRVGVSCSAAAAGPCALRLTASGHALATTARTVAPGSSAQIAIKLNAAARRSVRRHGLLKASLALYEGAAKRVTTTVTLRPH